MFTAKDFRAMKTEMFATRETTEDAFADAVSMLKRDGVDQIVAMTAILMFSNTMLEQLAKSTEQVGKD
jgi:hypothetical protein